MIKTEQLYYLTELNKTRSFHKCAEKLFVSQPAISRSIKNLEKELDVPLLERSASGVVPTAVGEKIIQKADVILSKMEALYVLCEEEQLQQTVALNALHLSAFNSFTANVLPPVITALQREFEEASFYFHEHSLEERLAFVSKSAYHIGFDYLPRKAVPSLLEAYPELEAAALCEVTFHCLARADTDLVPTAPIDASVARETPIPVVSCSRGPAFFQGFFGQLVERGVIDCVFETSAPKLYYMYISEGLAAAVVSKLGDFKYIFSLPRDNYRFTPIQTDDDVALFFFYNKAMPQALRRYILHHVQKSLRA